MNRRRLLAGVGAAVGGALAGCAGSGDESGGDGSPSTGTPTDGGPPRVTDRSFARTGDCDAGEEGFAAVTYGGSTVRCEGCLAGADGCAEAALASAEYDAEADALSVVVATESESDRGTACTQRVVHRSYRELVTFAGGVPGETVVYHESTGERTEATRASA
ncbi:hypothetical protein [Candidatus Halobonum tyrrellensis]|uniref:Lipoprotein n=1 Tax=Candidatus Halobonum tyrrellensis G22 TaxID=1324957 RepID=V4GVZ6_9EURY|nr:hypothetical protein [Candidatus Halobonum tyrrellensis]ESP89301.1 hypothetical protein K933_04766 [Candidatus Halobonum tyrrellensis G22]